MLSHMVLRTGKLGKTVVRHVVPICLAILGMT